MPKPKISIPIRGVIYESQKEAAEALGVSRAAIAEAYKRGTLDYVGLGPRRGKGNNTKTVIKGRVFEKRKDAAKFLGVSHVELGCFIKVATLLGIDYS